MVDLEQGSLEYFMSRPEDRRWAGVLRALADELSAQMSASEIRAFFVVLGKRWAQAMPLPKESGAGLNQFERAANAVLGAVDWGWMRVRDQQSSVEIDHCCAPLRKAFGPAAMEWSSGLLEGLYAEWLRGQGAEQGLLLRQVGLDEGVIDTWRFRLATAEHFASSP
jgi:hypothetical protein